MDLTDVLKTFLPEWLFDYFDLTGIEDTEERIDLYLDEKKLTPKDWRDEPLISHGFTSAYVVQDFPIKGKEVYLHLRRRKWLVLRTNQIVSCSYDIAHEGTRLTKEFVAFLKATN